MKNRKRHSIKGFCLSLVSCLSFASCTESNLQPEAPSPTPVAEKTPLPTISPSTPSQPSSSATPPPTPSPTATESPEPPAPVSPTPSPDEASPAPSPSATSIPSPAPIAKLPPLKFARLKVIVGNGEVETPDNGERTDDMGLSETLSALFVDENDYIWMLQRSGGVLGHVTPEIVAPEDATNFFEPYRKYWIKYQGLNTPQSVVIDKKNGDLYILERNNHRVVRLNKNLENLTIIAGTGEAGYNAERGVANQMQLNNPEDIALDSMGNLYITDTGNHLIRKVTPEGEMSTFAGQYILDTKVPDTENNRNDESDDDDVPTFLPLGETSGDGGDLTNARLDAPHHIAVDDTGAIYFTSDSNTIRRIKGNAIDVHIGTGSFFGYNGDGLGAKETHLAQPTDLVFGPDGLLYFVDYLNRRVRRLNADGLVQNIAGSGKKGSYTYSLTDPLKVDMQPEFITFDDSGNLYLYDSDHIRIRMAEVEQSTQ